MTAELDAIRAWNRKHRKDFVAVPEDVLSAALATIEPSDEYELSFCPKCGCTRSRTTENMASYPEQWVKTTCSNCDFLLGEIDNSEYQHCFDYKEDNYVIEI